MQEDLNTLGVQRLLDMLKHHNDEYAELILKGSQTDFDICRYRIMQIHHELNLRKQSEIIKWKV